VAYDSGTTPTLAQLITGKFIPTKFSKDVIMHTKSNLVVAPRVNNEYRKELVKGSVVNIPVFTEGTTSEVTPGTVPTAVNLVGTSASITVNRWRKIATEISDMAQIEDLVDYFKGAAESLSYSIIKDVDTYLGTLFSGLNGSTPYGTDGQTFTDAIFRALVETLDEADVPDDGKRVLIGDPSFKADVNNVDKYISTDFVRTPVVPQGRIGQIYNTEVFQTNNLTAATTGNYGVLMHKNALGLVIQENPRSQVVPMPQEFRTLLIVDVIYGAQEIRDTFGISFYTRKS